MTQPNSISGIILDSDTENPISNVSVYIEETNVGTTTSDEGYFTLYLNNQSENEIDLSIRMIGYDQKSIQVRLSKNIIDLGKVFLKTKTLELDIVHIHSQENKSSQISDISLSGQALSDNLTGNIATTLSSQPNIGVNSFGTVTSKPVLRGYSGDRFLLTKDGSKTGDLSQSSIDHVITLDMNEVNQIEIIRGPKTLMYGSNAIGGVINTGLNTDPRLRVDKFISKFLFGGESFNSGLYGNANLYVPIKNSQINVLISNRDTGSQSSPIGKLDNTYSKTFNSKLGFTKYNEGGYVNFIIGNFSMDYGIPPSLEGHINGVDIELVKNTFQINYHQHISLYNFNQFDIRYDFVDYEHKEFENNLDYFSVALSKKTHNFKLEIESNSSVIGSELNYKQFSPSGFYWTPPTDELNLSLYGFTQIEFDNFDFLSSIRFGHLSIKPDQNNINFSNLDNEQIKNRNFKYLSSSVGLKKVIDKFEINSWIMSTMRGPSVEELYSDGPHLGSYSYEIGEPNLELEKIYGVESSIKYNEHPLSLSLSAFYNYSPYYYQMSKMGECSEDFIIGESHPCAGADFIEWGSGTSGWLYKYQTRGVEAVIKGLEFNLSYNYEPFKISYDFSLVAGDDLTEGVPLSYMNPAKQVLNFEYDKKIMKYKIRLSNIHSQDRLGEFETYTPSSFLVDFVVSYSNNNHNVTIQLNNILNNEYYNHLSKIKSIMPEAGRNIIISYGLYF